MLQKIKEIQGLGKKVESVNAIRIYGAELEGTRYFCSLHQFASMENSSLAKCLIRQVTLFALCAHVRLLKVRPEQLGWLSANFEI
jgi:hypothetical protein